MLHRCPPCAPSHTSCWLFQIRTAKTPEPPPTLKMHPSRMPQPRLRRGMTLKSKTQPHLRCGMMMYISLRLPMMFLPWVTSGERKWVTLAERRSRNERLSLADRWLSRGGYRPPLRTFRSAQLGHGSDGVSIALMPYQLEAQPPMANLGCPH